MVMVVVGVSEEVDDWLVVDGSVLLSVVLAEVLVGSDVVLSGRQFDEPVN